MFEFVAVKVGLSVAAMLAGRLVIRWKRRRRAERFGHMN